MTVSRFDPYSVAQWDFVGKNVIRGQKMWVKKCHEQHLPRWPEPQGQVSFVMPWVAANPPQSSSSFGDYPALSGAGISFSAQAYEDTEIGSWPVDEGGSENPRGFGR